MTLSDTIKKEKSCFIRERNKKLQGEISSQMMDMWLLMAVHWGK